MFNIKQMCENGGRIAACVNTRAKEVVRFDIKKIYKLASKVSEKVLVQVEGATCSGKSSFVLDTYRVLKRKGIDAMTIEEAAAKVLIENNSLLIELTAHPTSSKQWEKSKMKLQKKVLSHQLEALERFAENDVSTVAIMDRGGASTAYHTIPVLSDNEKELVEGICREIGRMSSHIILLSPIGFLDRSSPRYQKTLEEIELEYRGIRSYLDKWKLDYSEITSARRDTRVRTGIRYITALLDKMTPART